MILRSVHSTPVQYFNTMQVVHCIENGLPLLIENLPEDIDIVMDNLIGKKTIPRGKANIIKMGDLEVEMHPRFRYDQKYHIPSTRFVHAP